MSFFRLCLFQLLLSFLFISSINGQTIQDVPKTDGYYPAIQKAVKHGYMSTYDSGNFEGNRTLTRKEMAIILSKLHQRMAQKGLNLRQSELSELVHLSSRYKDLLSDMDATVTQNHHSLLQSIDQQKDFQIELAGLTQELKETQDQQLYLWMGIGLSALLGILIK